MPIALYVLFVLSLLPIMLAWLGGYLRYREFGQFDNHHPRLQQHQQSGIGARALAAQKNSWETLLLFLLVLFIAEASPLELASLSGVSLLFLCLRLAYIAAYLTNRALLRSLLYALGMGCCLYIVFLAALSY